MKDGAVAAIGGAHARQHVEALSHSVGIINLGFPRAMET